MFGEEQRQEVSSYGAGGELLIFSSSHNSNVFPQKKGEGIMSCAAAIISEPRPGVLTGIYL